MSIRLFEPLRSHTCFLRESARCAALTWTILASTAMTAGTTGTALAARFTIESGAKGNSVRFESKAPAESFDGKTSKITGTIEFDPAALGDSITVNLEVDAASLDTGIAIRNGHMRKNHLHTDRFPKIIFRGARILTSAPGMPDTKRAAALVAGQTAIVGVEGTFELHGVARRIQVPAEVTWSNEGGVSQVHIVSKFTVKLSDFEIPRPQFLVMKLDEVQRITFDVTAKVAP